MSRKKQKKLHKCINHPSRRARGRCSVCDTWLCHECAVLKNGKFYCVKGCNPTSSSALVFSSVIETQSQTVPIKVEKIEPVSFDNKISDINKLKLSPVILTLSITVAMLILFSLILVKENRLLSSEIISIKEKNSTLKKLVIKRNRFIKKLKGDTLDIKTIDIESDSIKKDEFENISKKNSSKSPPAGIFKSSGRSYSYSNNRLPLTFDNGSTDKKLIALTFDGGSHKKAANEILNTLKEKKLKATMFFTGEFIRKNGDLVKRVLAEGHEIGNHTYSHPHLTSWEETRIHSTLPNINEPMLRNQLIKANELYKKVTGENMKPLWRAPYGERNNQINRWARDAGYLQIGWKQARSWWLNYDTNDWVPDRETPGYFTGEQVVEKFTKLSVLKPNGMNGAIILMHLGNIRKVESEQVHKYLGQIIDNLRGEGYTFVKVTDMVRESGVDLSLLRRRD